jgi:3-isopropylmalate dehydrogenase
LDAFVNVRPCIFPSVSLASASPLKAKLVENVHFIILRELCGGIYFGDKEEAP